MYKRYIRNTFLSLPYDDEDDQKKIFFSSFIFQKFSEKKKFLGISRQRKETKKVSRIGNNARDNFTRD